MQLTLKQNLVALFKKAPTKHADGNDLLNILRLITVFSQDANQAIENANNPSIENVYTTVSNVYNIIASSVLDHFSYDEILELQTITIPQYQQMIVQDMVSIGGTLDIQGTLVII